MTLKYLKKEMYDYISPHIIERGADYYRADMIEEIQVLADAIHAVVTGSYGFYHVQVDIHNFTKSECDCPYDDYCKHLAAVIFAVTAPGFQETKSSPSNPQELQQNLSAATKEELLEIIDKLQSQLPGTAKLIKEYFEDKKDLMFFQSDDFLSMNVSQSFHYFQKEVRERFQDFELSFNRSAFYDDEWEIEYDDPDDYDEGLDRISQWADSLISLIQQGHYIQGITGLLFTIKDYISLSFAYEDSYGFSRLDYHSEIVEEPLFYGLDLLAEKYRESIDIQESVQHLLKLFINECKTLEDILEWKEIIGHLILDSSLLEFIKEEILIRVPELKEETDNHREKRFAVMEWWIEQCLKHGSVEDALTAEKTMGVFVPSISSLFIDYYLKKENLHDARNWLERSMAGKMELQHLYKMIEILKKSQSFSELPEWYEKLFLRNPNNDTFIQAVSSISDKEEAVRKTEEWIFLLEDESIHTDTVISMLLHISETERAWNQFLSKKQSFRTPSAELFSSMKAEFPDEIIRYYAEIISSRIQLKNREAYREAANLIKDLKQLYTDQGKEEEFDRYYDGLLADYHRYRAFRDELYRAGFPLN